MSFIPGYLATISVDAQAINIWSTSASLTKTTNAIPTPVLGETHDTFINGKKATAMQATLHLDTAGLVALQAADDSTVPVVCVFRPGALGASTDAGSYTGDGIITEMVVAGGEDDNWSVDLSIQGTAVWPYTAPV